MRKALRVGLTLFALIVLCGVSASQTLAAAGGNSSSRSLATITGSVRDNKGNPLAGAVVSLLKEGAGAIVKQVTSGKDGSFTARIAPGLYTLRATAAGFGEVLFSSVQVRRSEELVYRFNLEPVGSGRTAPERRRDRNDPKWRILGTRSSRSIFQVGEPETEQVAQAAAHTEDNAAVDENLDIISSARTDESRRSARMKGVVETYFTSSADPLANGVAGVNFAFSRPVSSNLDFIIAGQTGIGAVAPQRLEATARIRLNPRHRVGLSIGGMRVNQLAASNETTPKSLGQISMRAVDEWVVRDGVVIVLGLDYSRFVGASNARSISPRFGLQFDADARTRVRAAYAQGNDEMNTQSWADFEDGAIAFKQPVSVPVALVDGGAVMERSHRLEFGVERILDDYSSVEATAFFDTTSNRGVGLLSTPLSSFSGGESGETLISVANQQGAARGMRVVYTRRVSRIFSASAGYSFGRGQELSANGLTNPSEVFDNGFFQTAAMQVNADLDTGTRVRTVFRFSPGATVFAIDPFAGRLAVYDPSLSILITQELPTFGLPVRAEALIDARNLLDSQTGADDGEQLTTVNATRRSLRGGIAVRF
ncbi:MAG TPA: carboxypeptidase-like regulatory domain-containing protein [Pyrinomonadaceae bacterium]